jgi:hypothetical protein
MDIMLYFGRRGRENLRELNITFLALTTDAMFFLLTGLDIYNNAFDFVFCTDPLLDIFSAFYCTTVFFCVFGLYTDHLKLEFVNKIHFTLIQGTISRKKVKSGASTE